MPLRIIVIAILLYIGYRLIVGGKTKKPSHSDKAKKGKNKEPIEDVLVEDPVCLNLVPRQQAVHLKHNGEMVYFCSEECCKKFVKDKGEGK